MGTEVAAIDFATVFAAARVFAAIIVTLAVADAVVALAVDFM